MEGPGPETREQQADEYDEPSVLRSTADRYTQTLDKTLRASLVPYGYTVTVWSSGAYLVKLRGVPTVSELFVFVLGAIIAFGALSTLARRPPSRRHVPPSPIHPDSQHPLVVAGVHIVAVGVTFLIATLVDRALGDAAWFAGSFTVTFAYLALASAELALASEIHEREIGLAARRMVRRRVRRPLGGRFHSRRS